MRTLNGIVISDLELDMLKVCCGNLAQLPYNEHTRMMAARRRLEELGLIKSGYEEDQPTSYATEAGEEFLKELSL